MIRVRFLSDAELQKLLIEAKVTETEIMQYADGVLAPRRRPAVRSALASYPDLMQLLESFLFTRGPVAEAFAEVYAQAPSEQLIARLEEAERPPVKPRRKLFGFSSPSPRPFKFKFRAPVVAVAALAAVVLTAGLTSYVARYDFIPPDRQGVVAPPLLQQALEVTPMGEIVNLAQDLSVEPTLTFFSRLNMWCREHWLVYAGSDLWQAQLACRGKDSVWRVREQTNPLRGRPTIQMAGENAMGRFARARGDLKHRKLGDMLALEEEALLLKNGWRRQP